MNDPSAPPPPVPEATGGAPNTARAEPSALVTPSATAPGRSDDEGHATDPGGQRRRAWPAVVVLALIVAAVVAGVRLFDHTPHDGPAGGPELVVLDWPYDIPQSVIDDFERRHNVSVRTVYYTNPEEVVSILDADPAYDVAAIDYAYVLPMAQAGKLAPIDLNKLANFRYVDPGFRNLVFDPSNRYSVPASWTAIGVLAATGVFTGTDVGWSDLWDVDLGGGKIAVWSGSARHLIAATLKRLGYSANSEDPTELAAARAELLRLRPRVLVVNSWIYGDYVLPVATGQIRAAIGDTAIYKSMRDLGLPGEFYYPREGALLWGDSLVIPAQSRNPALAHLFIDTVLSPQVAATIMEHKYMRSTNQAAVEYTTPSRRYNDVLFPSLDTLRRAELILPLSAAGQQRWDAIWAEFVAD